MARHDDPGNAPEGDHHMENEQQEQPGARRVAGFFAALERMSAQPDPAALSPEEVATEIEAMRARQRGDPDAL